MGEIKLRKKAIFFTFIAITTTILFIFLFTPQAGISLDRNTEAVKGRIGSVDNYVNDLKNRYFENILRSTSHRAMLSLVSYIEVKKSFIPESDFNSVFSEVMLSGNISDPIGSNNHVPIDTITGKSIMTGNTLLDWSAKIKNAAKDTLNVDTTITIKPSSVNVSQDTPWKLEPNMELDFTVKAGDANAEWTGSKLAITTNMSILGFNDPYYLVNTNGAYKNPIKKSNVEPTEWDIAKVTAQLKDGNYTHFRDSEGMSFLMKLTGALKQSACCGIESFVAPSIASPSEQKEVYLDYLFWNPSSNPTCPTPLAGQPELYTITALPAQFNGFKLDPASVFRYNIKGNAVKSC